MTAIDTLLEQAVAELQGVLAVIDAERRSLIAGEIDRLPGIAEQKAALTTRLASLETQRDTALEAGGFGPGRKGMEAWLAANPAASRTARNAWDAYMELAAAAGRENELNGKLIAAHLQQNRQALDTLLGESADAATYGADGQRRTASGRRQLGSA